ncbi:hypothetical protein, partial [Burkholderia sp. LMG 13014]|uniref:hypothetical protein n=1 Tax=Burkholderia sp. LMG 13014 TaxID=2709306 RepID=UPI001962E5F0
TGAATAPRISEKRHEAIQGGRSAEGRGAILANGAPATQPKRPFACRIYRRLRLLLADNLLRHARMRFR